MSPKKSFLLRLPPDLWEELNRWARDEVRSVNGQIEYVLRQAVRKRRSDNEREKRKEKNKGAATVRERRTNSDCGIRNAE